ncbi:GNAT family N-acetyltransferase [Flavobacterium sp.]|uniref:GNAT family N-acetyltransferase n=1 Tax=Flavobacterium sp. TaxID=239 RepID=UPI0035B4CBF5
MDNNTFKIYTTTDLLPENWNEVAIENEFLQKNYLSVLEKSAPVNMQCFYIGIFEKNELIGVALAQFLDLNKLTSFGERDKCLKTTIRNFIFRNFASHVLFIGNNMITGQNGYSFSKEMDFACISKIMNDCANELKDYFAKQGKKIHIVSFKDFYEKCAKELKKHEFKNYHEFNIQPNMIFNLQNRWKSFDEYINSFTKKYRDQYKRARKKFDSVIVKELTITDVESENDRIYNLYYHVAKNAPFNTFFLSKNHFETFKKQCDNRFKIYGYYFENKLVGFHTILVNGKVLETYFLGYDETVQKDKMLYLNMLYNMTQFGIENNFEKILFGRTAMEIKSSIGAEPIYMSGFIYHTNKLINKYIDKLFDRLEPKVAWQQRHPFK